MGGVAVLHPQDVLKDRLNYNRIPLISPLKPRDRKPNFIPNSNSNPKTVSNSNRRKRSPQKKNDVSRSPPSKSSNLGHNLTAGSGLLRSPPKGAQTLVMEKVKILKRGEALTNDEKVEKKMVVFEKENKNEKMVPLEKNEKMVVSEKNEVLEVSKINDDLEALQVLKRLGPEPDMVLKQTRLADFYAGTGFVDSPDPRLVPVPFFFKKKDEEIELAQKKDGVNDDNGSIHLRRLLNLAF